MSSTPPSTSAATALSSLFSSAPSAALSSLAPSLTSSSASRTHTRQHKHHKTKTQDVKPLLSVVLPVLAGALILVALLYALLVIQRRRSRRIEREESGEADKWAGGDLAGYENGEGMELRERDSGLDLSASVRRAVRWRFDQPASSQATAGLRAV
ncbi:hypothetical protein JCM8097_008923 [Rhodosporidiobolus ruineniae]